MIARAGRRRGLRNALTALLTACALALTGCSHTSPYYAPSAISVGQSELMLFPSQIVTRVILIGDAGEPLRDDPLLAALGSWASEIPTRTIVVFLGDNVYPHGIVDERDEAQHAETTWRLEAQIDAVRSSGARAIFMPGNHDWAHGGADGLLALEREERLVTAALGRDAFQPPGGCPGPEAVDLDGVRLVLFDSMWFFQETPASPCPADETSFFRELDRLVAGAGERQVFVLAHHPLRSRGPHGGFFDWKDHLFPLTRLASWAYVPLPVIGSLYPFVRGTLNPSNQDLGHSHYRHFVSLITDALRPHRPLLYAAGHEHVLQVFDGGDAFGYTLVSGAGSAPRITTVSHDDATLFALAQAGFMCVDVLENGEVALRVVEPGTGVVFSRWLTKGG